MAYVYKKIVGGKPYYYLRVSERKNGKIVIKDIAYLGSSIDEAKKAIHKLPQEKIRKAYRQITRYLESNHYLEKAAEMKLKKDAFLGGMLEEVEACKIHYNAHFKKLDELTKKEILKNFVIEFSYNTTSMEGNTINLEEARNLLTEGFTPKDKTLREIYDLQNTEKVFMDIYGNVPAGLSHELIVKIHDELLENIDVRKGYRKTDIRVIRSNFDASPAQYVLTDMNLLLKWYKENESRLYPLVLAVIFHHKFEKIHPFMDGNGRTGRMLMNCILLKHGFPPIMIRKKNRIDYLEALRDADRSGPTANKKEDYAELVKHCAAELAENYWNVFL